MTRELKVGLFVIFGLVLTMISVFLIGDTKQLWAPKGDYRTAFRDVAGLKPGAPVRMGGLDIGAVTTVGHDRNLADTRIFVGLSITQSEASRIRADTIARVVNKGLLGDKMVELSVGSPSLPAVDRAVLLPSEDPSDLFSSARRVAESTEEAIEHLKPLALALGDPRLAEDLKGSVADVRAILDGVVRSDGVMHRLFFDKAQADAIRDLVVQLGHTTARADAVLSDVEELSAQVRRGPGLAHALLYDADLQKSVAGVASEVHQDLRALREGNGIAHSILYGDDKSQHVMTNLNAMSDDLRVVVSGLRQGKGTLGALLVDPTVYEDIRSVVGNVERNEVLRALVRYSIKADEKK